MTSEEKRQVISLAARFEPYVTFISLLRMLGEAPKDRTFEENLEAITEKLQAEYESCTKCKLHETL